MLGYRNDKACALGNHRLDCPPFAMGRKWSRTKESQWTATREVAALGCCGRLGRADLGGMGEEPSSRDRGGGIDPLCLRIGRNRDPGPHRTMGQPHSIEVYLTGESGLACAIELPKRQC